MTQEEKQLLLIDLCARLPYDIMVDYESHIYILNEIDPACKDINYITVRIQDVERLMCAKSVMIGNIKPYLRPMSSMTEEEMKSLPFPWVNKFGTISSYREEEGFLEIQHDECSCIIDWLNAHHFDYRGLIEKCLAISTEKFNPYKD